MNKHILHINSADNWAGGEVYTHLVCSELEKRGFDVVLVCRPNSIIGQVFLKQGRKVLPLPLTGAADMRSAHYLAKYCREQSIEVVHSHLGRDYWLAAFVKLIYPSVKVVFTRHVLIPAKNSLLHKWMFSKADTVIAVSQAVKRAFLKTAPVLSGKVVTIHNGIDIDKFKQASSGLLRGELGIEKATPLIGMVGHVSPHKGQEIFINSIPEIRKNNPLARFVIVGSDFKSGLYIEELKRLADHLNIGDIVYFLGERKDIPQVMADLDIFVLASKEEPFGLVITEAMAAQAAVVATQAGGVTEIIEDEQDGLLIEYGQAEALAQAVLRLLDDHDLYQRLVDNALTKVKQKFSVKLMMDQMVTVYQTLCDKGK